MFSMAQKVVAQGMSVRELEHWAQRTSVPREKKTPKRDVVFGEAVQRLEDRFGTKIKISGSGSRMQLKLEGLDQGQVTALLEILEERGAELFPGK
jgi:ParB family chromosome partitioning protein